MTEKQDKEWFASWFDSPYYHTLYKNRNHDEAELFIDKLISFFAPPPHARFLDLACGKGRHSIFLNRHGFDVTGVDLSPESIKSASEFENEQLHFYVHDMRRLFRTNYFDFILNLFTSFGYFEHDRDEAATIDAIAKGLKPEGVFVIDFFNAEKVKVNLKESEELVRDDIHFQIRKKLEDGYILKQIDFTDKGKKFHFEERVKALTLSDFQKYFDLCGLKTVHLWGGYDLSPFDIDKSDRLIIAAKK
ncbi:MAG: Methyltransferase type 11 [Bacteroidota bacterium]|jgi:SAM-dependent methyltransferase|nr:Methyltransferase type 11 [Bacteroidota bacterium]